MLCQICGGEMEYLQTKDAYRCQSCGRLLMRVEAEISQKVES